MEYISFHNVPLVINSLGGRQTHTHTHTNTHIHILMIYTGSISGNKACAGLWPARALFKYSIEADSSLDCTLTAN